MMKSILSLLIFVGVAFCNSTNYYGWAPNRELVYRFESQVLTGVSNIRDSQQAGLRLTSEVRVQAFSDYTLRVKFEKSKFLTVNGDVNLSERGRLVKGSETENGIHEAEIPRHLKSFLEKPMVVHMKRGIVESFFVEADEPTSITNIKRAFLSQIQLDITASRRSEIESNHVEVQGGLEDRDIQTPLEEVEGVTYFTTREETLLGDCQTSYTVHQLPKYRSIELEEQWKQEAKKIFQQLHSEESKASEVCEGKQYYRITKNKNLDNCRNRPVYQKATGVESRCDSSKAACTDLRTHMVSTSCIVCGDLDKFVIRKCLKKDALMTNPLAWNTDEKVRSAATVLIELLKEESRFSPIQTPDNLKEKKSLVFEYPESNQRVSGKQANYHRAEQAGIVAVLEQPDLKSAYKMPITNLAKSKSDISRQVIEELKRIAVEVFESPESCSSSGDVAGYLTAISKYLQSMSYDELKAIKNEIIESSAGRRSEGSNQALKSLFFDVLSVVGTNPSTMLIKKEIESGELKGRLAVNVLESAIRSIKTPTKELLKELVQLVKSIKHLSWNEESDLAYTPKDLYAIGLVQVSKLIYRACVHPVRRITEFPVRIYGHFCSNESSIITDEWIPLLESELKAEKKDQLEEEHLRLVAITALGKLGHIKALKPLVKVIDGTISTRPLVRSVAVYALKRVVKLNPSLVRPILLAIIDNPVENVRVRIAAVAVLPWSQPSTAQLQKVAVRTWFEPSKQVSSFIYSTLKSLVDTEVPELKAVGRKAESLIQMIKPQEYGLQFAHNANYAEFVDYLKTAISKKVSWSFTEEEMIPARISLSNAFYHPSWAVRGLSFSVYTQGMDNLLDKVLFHMNKKSPVSESVKEQLEKIAEELKIEKRESRPSEVFIQSKMLGFERMYTLNKEYITEYVERMTENLRRNPKMLEEGQHYELTRSVQISDVQTVAPSSSGFLIVSQRVVPVVYSIKGFIKGENRLEGPVPLPTKVIAKVMPIINAKIHSHVAVICPFTDELIGAGVDAAIHLTTPLEAEIELSPNDQLSVSIKTPESIRKQIELVHVYITPYTVKKSLLNVQPLSKASHIKPILSRTPLKKIDIDLGKKVSLSSKLIAESDAKYVDLYSYWEKIQQHSIVSIASLGLLPSSIRKTSAKIVYNPSESDTKELTLRFSLAKGHKQEEGQEAEIQLPQQQTDEQLIKKICKENFPEASLENQKCQSKLEQLDIISREAEEICHQHTFSHEVERMRCHKTTEICQRALTICESQQGPRSGKCQDKREACLSRVHNVHAIKKVLQQMGKQSKVSRVQISASIHGRNNRHTVKTVLQSGASVEDQGRIVKYFAGAEIEVPEKSTSYQVAYESKVVFPEINNRWNTKQLLEDDLKMEIEGKLKYGKKENLKEISFKSILEKSDEQKESVRASPEFRKCAEHEEKDKVLSPVCMKVRHQAASIDKIVLSIEAPEEMTRLPAAALKVEELIKSLFLGQIAVEKDSSVSSPKEFRIRLNISREGDEAQLKVERPGHQWVVRNIRLHSLFKGVLPLSLRNKVSYRLIQKITHNQAPASCRVEPKYIGTFDNKTVHYEMNDCKHLLVKDCSGRVPIAVLARKQDASRTSKIVEILAGTTKVVLTPVSNDRASGMKINLKVNEESRDVELAVGQIYREKCPKSGEVAVEMKRYSDNVYNVHLMNEMLQVITDGLRIEVIAPQLVHGRTCGLCGDFNGENTADLKSPRQCLMKKDSHFAYSYMIENAQCSGIPQPERALFEEDQRECIKKRDIITPLRSIERRLQQLALPLVSVHMVEKQENQVCISRQRVKVCAHKSQEQAISNKLYLDGQKPVELQQRLVDYTCVALPSQKAFSLERRAKAGENLQAELQDRPVHFSKMEYEPVLCAAQNQQQQQQQPNF